METISRARGNTMKFAFWPAFLAGVGGGASMIAMRMLLQGAGIDLTFEPAALGNDGPGPWHGWAGAGDAHSPCRQWWHRRDLRLVLCPTGCAQSLLGLGLLGGAILWIIAGLFMAIVPFMHPQIPESLPAPGGFLINFGIHEVVSFLVGHFLYGLVVGILYARLHSAGGTGAITC